MGNVRGRLAHMPRLVATQKNSAPRARGAAATGHGAASRPRGPRPARGRPTRERILDSAEKLFARRGFHGVSVRDITQDAGVDVALVNYHFGTKQALLDCGARPALRGAGRGAHAEAAGEHREGEAGAAAAR